MADSKPVPKAHPGIRNPRVSIRDERSANQRKKILLAALDLMTDRGYNATSMRDLAKASGCTQANIYHYFGNKEELFQALLDAEGGKVSEALSPDRYLEAGPLGNLEIFSQIFEELFENNRAFFRLMAIDFVEFEGKHYHKFFTESPAVRAPQLRDTIEGMTKQGIFREVSFDVTLAAFIYPLYMYFTVEKLFGAEQHLELPDMEVMKQLRDIFLLGMVKDPALRKHLEAGGEPPSLKPENDYLF